MPDDDLKRWRNAERARLIAERMGVDEATIGAWRMAIDANLASAFHAPAWKVLAFCWPIRNEYDARHYARTLRERGTLTALPVVIAPKTPLVFREWHPGLRLAQGALGIAYPADSREVTPEAVLLPMNGWDERGYRLGYGGGFFDRTLARLPARPLVIGVAYEMARMPTIHPQDWDIPVDCVVTERRVIACARA